MRGLKLQGVENAPTSLPVAPHAGAWIETYGLSSSSWSWVAPHAGAWIETKKRRYRLVFIAVAPHAGAWIETWSQQLPPAMPGVAPHAGAWIETFTYPIATLPQIMSHPTRVRGLKR